MGNFDVLYTCPDYKVLCNRKQLTRFVDDHINNKGIPIVMARGRLYTIEWESKGAGMYLVSLKEKKYD